MVLHGCSRQRQAGARRQPLDCVRANALIVFDLLRLIQNGKPKGNAFHQINVPANERVTGQHHIRRVFADLRNLFGALRL